MSALRTAFGTVLYLQSEAQKARARGTSRGNEDADSLQGATDEFRSHRGVVAIQCLCAVYNFNPQNPADKQRLDSNISVQV